MIMCPLSNGLVSRRHSTPRAFLLTFGEEFRLDSAKMPDETRFEFDKLRVPLTRTAIKALSWIGICFAVNAAVIVSLVMLRWAFPEITSPIVRLAQIPLDRMVGDAAPPAPPAPRLTGDRWDVSELGEHGLEIEAATKPARRVDSYLQSILRGDVIPPEDLESASPFQDLLRTTPMSDPTSVFVVREWFSDGCIQVISSQSFDQDAFQINRFFVSWKSAPSLPARRPSGVGVVGGTVFASTFGPSRIFAFSAAAADPPKSACPPEDEDVEDPRRYRCSVHSEPRPKSICVGRTDGEWTKIWSIYADKCVSYRWVHQEFGVRSPEYFTRCTH
jgi:hypothetical protein